MGCVTCRRLRQRIREEAAKLKAAIARRRKPRIEISNDVIYIGGDGHVRSIERGQISEPFCVLEEPRA